MTSTSRYLAERPLGRGGMAAVELATDQELGRRVAIKRLSAEFAADDVFRERFLREGRIAAQLSHPNIVAVYDVGDEDGLPYLVMEYVEGETLADLIRREAPLAPDRAVDLVLQACAGLEHAHAAGLVHRDVKPQNLLVRDDGTLKIADFGIARPLGGTQLTEAGTVLGTAAYLAPEQAAAEPVTAAADIYSLGAVTYEVLAGRPPYEFESLADLPVLTRQQPPPLPEPARPLESVVRESLAFDPRDRPESAAAFARELALAAPEPPTEPLRPSAATAATAVMAKPSRQIRRTWTVGGAVLAAAAIAGGLALALSGGEEEPPAPTQPPRADVLPRGETPAESARLLADWLRARAG